MEIRLILHDINGGAPIPVLATWTSSGIVLNKVQGDCRVSQAYLPVYNLKGGEPVNIVVNIHDDGTIDFGQVVSPPINEGVVRFETPNQDNALQVSVSIAGDGTPTLSTAVTVTGSGAPTYDSSRIGNVSAAVVEVRFSEKVTSADFTTGVVIKKNTVQQNILSAARQADHATVRYTLDTPADANDTVTWEYDSGTGDIADQTDGTVLASVTAKTVTNNIPGDPPVYSAGEIGAVLATTVVATFTKKCTAVGDDYSTGVTIKVNGAAAVIASGTRQADHKVIYYVIPAVDANDVVTWEYSATTGIIKQEDDGSSMATIAAQPVVNTVAGVAPTFTSAEVGLVNATTVHVVFSVNVSAVGDDYTTGVTIKKGGVAQAISAGVRQANHANIYYTIPAVVNGNVLTIEYASPTGIIKNEADGTALATFGAQAVTNNVA